MTDLRDRMRIYDQAPAPDYWNEVQLRAASGSVEAVVPTRSARRLLLLAAAMLLLALTVGGAALVLSRLVDPSPDGSVTRLAYGVDGDIYLAEMDGTNPMRIADGVRTGDATECENSFYGFGPMWSPDGRYFAYRSDHWGELVAPACPGTVYLSDADGQPVASFPGTGWHVSWSPDSTRIATWVELYETIGIYGIDGARQAVLTRPDECRVAGDYDPLWSPDGSSIVIPGPPQAGEDLVGSPERNPEACELPLDGSAARVLPASDPRYRQLWSYSPDGASVAYVVEPAPDPYDGTAPPPDVSLVVAAADGSNERVLISTGVSPLGSPVLWSPTGDRIAVAGGEVGVPKEVLVVDVASGTVTSAFSAGTNDIIEVMAFSPDADRILFAVRDADWVAKGLWSVKVDGSDARLHVAGTDWGDWQLLPPGSQPLPNVVPSAAPSGLPSTTPTATAPTSVDGGTMLGTHVGHTASLLLDGRVLIAGGVPDFGAEVYDAELLTWTATSDMVELRDGHSATVLRDGTVLVVGGADTDSGPAHTSAEIYDPAQDTWTATGSMVNPRAQHTATLLADGRVLVAGGFAELHAGDTHASVEIYDPATGLWTAAGGMNEPRAGHSATLLEDGSLLVAGGTDGPPATAELYDPVRGMWSYTGRMEVNRRDHPAVLLANGTVLVVGGWGSLLNVTYEETRVVEIYDPAVGDWTSLPQRLNPAVMFGDTIGEGPALVVLRNDTVLASDWWSGTVSLWDPGTGEWTSGPPLRSPDLWTGYSATLLGDGTVLLAGGWEERAAGLGPPSPYERYAPPSD